MTQAGAGSQDALRSAKRALRQQVLAARDATDRAARSAASAVIAGRLIELSSYHDARVVCAYCSFGSEFDTATFVADVLRRGKRLLLPRVDRAARDLAFHFVTDPAADLSAGTWGIPEPDPARCPIADLGEIDFMLVPGVAFTRDCQRLGYGGGFYDRVLARVRSDCFTVAAAFSMQLVPSLPTGTGDRKVNAIVTEA